MTKTVKIANYSPAQTALIVAAYVAKGAPLDFSDCETLASNPEMNDNDGEPRKARSIAAKISRMVLAGEGVEYARKVAVTKTGEPVTSKADIVAEISKRVSGNLDGLEKAPKAALVAIAKAVAA